MVASFQERNLMSSKGEYNWKITAPTTAKNEKYYNITNELTWLFNDLIITYATAVSKPVTSAKQRPTKYRIEYSEFSFPNIIGGFVIKITPIIQINISIAVLILIYSLFNTYTNMRVVHIGFVFIKTTASDTATNFNEEKQAKNPNIPIAPLNNNLFIIFLFFGYD